MCWMTRRAPATRWLRRVAKAPLPAEQRHLCVDFGPCQPDVIKDAVRLIADVLVLTPVAILARLAGHETGAAARRSQASKKECGGHDKYLFQLLPAFVVRCPGSVQKSPLEKCGGDVFG